MKDIFTRHNFAKLFQLGISPRLIAFAMRQMWFNTIFIIQHLYNLSQLWMWQSKVGSNLRTLGLIDISLLGGQLIIKDNVTLLSSSSRYNLAMYGPVKFRCFGDTAKIILEDHVWLNGTMIASRSQSIVIGTGTIFAANCTVIDSDFHNLWPPEERMNFNTNEFDAPVSIGKNCWLGLNSIVLKGTTIGDNVVIGAGSIVTGEIPSNCIAAGVPARVIKELP